jgi:hypothetical protein
MIFADRRRLEDAGIVHEHFDPPAEPLERRVPQPLGGARLGEVGGDLAALAGAAGVADGILPFERRKDGPADAAAGSGDEDVGRGARGSGG